MREARATVKKQFAQRAQQLDQRQAQLRDQSVRLQSAERSFHNQVHAFNASAIGDGTYVVGSDIPPGTYSSNGGSGCYWARLASLNTEDIIDNNISDGPQTVEILPSDKAFLTEGCGDWHRVG